MSVAVGFAANPLVLEQGVGSVVVEAAGPLGRVLRHLAGLPAAQRCRVAFTVDVDHVGTRWRRRYITATACRHADTHVRATAIGFDEWRGPVTLRFALIDSGQAALYSARFFGVPLPRRMLSSRVESVRTEAGLRTTVTMSSGGRLARLRYVAELSEVGR